MDPKKRYDNSGEAFEADINELFNIPETKEAETEQPKEEEEE